MVRQAAGTVGLVAALALVVPHDASAQGCEVPKAWQTAAVQLEYELDRELGLTQQHTSELLRTPSSQFGGAAVTYAGQRVTSSAYVVSAVARFGATVLSTPPDC